MLRRTMRRLTIALTLVAVLLTGSVFIARATAADAAREHFLEILRDSQASQGCSLNQGLWVWIKCVREAWAPERDRPGELCQQPWVSKTMLRGDCDDFAVMVAYYIEEYWGFDTFIVWINMEDAPDHYVAFVHARESLKNSRLRECLHYPYMTRGEKFYIPIDLTKCPNWHWLKRGGSIKTEEWEDLAGTPR